VHSPENIDTVRVQSGKAKKPQQIYKEGCSTTRDIQMIGAMNIEK
jgi:hypothetical protein